MTSTKPISGLFVRTNVRRTVEGLVLLFPSVLSSRLRAMADVSISNLVGEKLNSTKYSYWSTCTTSYLKVHDLWGSHGWHINCLTQKARFETSAWNQKAERALYVLKRTVTKEMISHIKDAKSPSQAWNALAILFNQAIDNEAVAIREAPRKRSQKAICHVNRSGE